MADTSLLLLSTTIFLGVLLFAIQGQAPALEKVGQGLTQTASE